VWLGVAGRRIAMRGNVRQGEATDLLFYSFSKAWLCEEWPGTAWHGRVR